MCEGPAALRAASKYGVGPEVQKPGRRCECCGARLNRYNKNARCAPCRAKLETFSGPPFSSGQVNAIFRGKR